MGHTKVRCKEPIKEDDGGFGAGGDSGGLDAATNGDNGGFGDFGAPAAGGGETWEASGGAHDSWTVAPAATTVGGGGVTDGW